MEFAILQKMQTTMEFVTKKIVSRCLSTYHVSTQKIAKIMVNIHIVGYEMIFQKQDRRVPEKNV